MVWAGWIEKGINKIEDMINANGTPRTDLQVPWLNVLSMYDSFPQEWKYWLTIQNVEEEVMVPSLYDKLKPLKSATKEVYTMLTSNENLRYKYASRWCKNGVEVDQELYKATFMNLRSCTKTTKYRDFQYRLLLDKIITNKNLFDWRKRPDPSCTFCRHMPETICHLLFYCSKIQEVLELFYELCRISIEHEEIDYSIEAFIFNYVIKKAKSYT